jgi:hypothetical protein
VSPREEKAMRSVIGSGSRRRTVRGRRGITSVLAMMFLVLFGSLSVGFYASVNTTVQISYNETKAMKAQVAADSGMAFMRLQMSFVNLPAGCPKEQILQQVYDQLKVRLENTPNLGTMKLGYSGSAITIPSGTTQAMKLDNEGAKFRAVIGLSGSDVQVTVSGLFGDSTSMSRGVRLTFKPVEDVSEIWKYGMAGNGTLSLSGGILRGIPLPANAARGSFFSSNTSTSTPLTMSGSATVTGQAYFTRADGHVSGSGSLGGITDPTKWASVTNANVAAPVLPVVNTQIYKDWMDGLGGTETVITGSMSLPYYKNIRIKAGTNPSLSGGPTIDGLIYIEAPNKVTFSGGAKITGVIVVDNPTEGTTTNSIIFSGGSTLKGPEFLDASYGALRTMTGGSILAPNFSVSLSGGSSTFGGSVLAKSLSMSGGSGGNVSGSVITYGTAGMTFSGGSFINFTNTGAAPKPVGAYFAGHLAADPETYSEVGQ